MRTVVLGPPPAELEALLQRRRELGQDGYDEVWEGAHHVAPLAHSWHGRVQYSLLVVLEPLARRAGLEPAGPVNLGLGKDDFRVPDGVVCRTGPDGLYVPTALLVVEVVSPDDETFEKFGFYAAHGVQEILTADPLERRVRLWARAGAGFAPVVRSDVLEVSAQELTDAVRWPR